MRTSQELDANKFGDAFISKFWSRVSVGSMDECWLWSGSTTKAVYGLVGHPITKKTLKPHRVSYALKVGVIPAGVLVCHTCDNTRCCNPAHLYGGSSKDNARDMDQRGRRAIMRGETHARAKLTKSQMLEIYRMPGKQRDIAAIYGVSQTCVWNIKNGRSWGSEEKC